MSWQNEMVVMLRHMIDDINCVLYDDTRLEQSILVAAQFVNLEIDFDKTYIIDIDELVLTPDPTAVTRDDAFINLVVLKSTCIILSGEAKAQALQAIRIKDGPTEIWTENRYKGMEARATKVCEEYQKAKLQYVTGTGRTGQAVLTPFTFDRFGSDPDRNFN